VFLGLIRYVVFYTYSYISIIPIRLWIWNFDFANYRYNRLLALNNIYVSDNIFPSVTDL
jgi:hypothetical protein